jgi:serine/threonine protein kinase/WD40 repeat protein
MTQDERILDLLANWAESRERGGKLAVDDLCRDEPDLSGELRARIEMLDAMRWLEDQRDEAPEGNEQSLPAYSTLVRKHEETLQAELQIPLAEFEHSLTSCGLVSAAEVRNIVEESGEQPVTSAVDLARALVLRGKLTPFQARLIALGKGQELVLGNYILLDKIGEGGMGQVFKARHRRMKRVVAIKVLPPSTMNSPHAVERFHREVEAVARLEHPNIVTAHDADEAGGRHFLAMQYVEGRDLASLVRSGGPLSIGQAVSVLLQAAAGLAYAHQQGIVHRDIKPGNLLIDRSGTLKILDLGLARIQADAGEDGSPGELTTDGTVMGTVDYMAPEQAVDTHAADARSDIYSLGCTLYYLLTGKPLFGGSTFMAKMLAHREQPIPDLAATRPETPTCLVQIFGKMVAKEPAQRPPSMVVLLEELKQCAELSEALALPSQWETGADRSPISSFEHIILRDSRETTSSRIEETIDLPDSQAGMPSEVTAPATKAHAAAVPEIPVATRPSLPLERGKKEELAVRWRQRPFVAAAIALALAGVILLAGIVYRIQTDRGTLIVEFDDEQVAANLQKDGLVIEDVANKRTWKLAAQAPEKLPTGEYKLAAPGGLKLQVTDDTGTEFATGEFTIKRGGKVIVRVTSEPLAVAANASPKPAENVAPTEPATPMPAGSTAATPASTAPAAETPSGTDPDRIAAEWVQRQKGELGLKLPNGSFLLVTHEQPLPNEPFVVDNFNLGRLQPPESDWSPLSGLRHLRQLWIFNAPATIPYAALKDVQSLQELRLSQFQDDDVLDGIETLPHLTKVWLAGSVNETLIASLAKHPNLRQLALDHPSHLPAEVFEDLTTLPALVDLYLNCPLDDEVFHFLAKLTNLTRLTLGHHLWNADQLTLLKPLEKLRVLDVGLVDDPRPPLAEMAAGMPDLEELRLTYARVLETSALEGLERHPTLTRLILHEAPVTEAWLPQFNAWKQLRELHYPASVGSKAEQELLRANPKLSLHFSNQQVLTYWNSGAVIEGPILFPQRLPGIRRWQLVTNYPQIPQSRCTYSPDGRLLAIASLHSSLVRVYDAETLDLRLVFARDIRRVSDLAFTADSQNLIIRDWYAVHILPLDGSRKTRISDTSYTAVAVHPKEARIALGVAHSGEVHLQPLSGQGEIVVCKGPAGQVAAIAWHPSGERLASWTGGESAVRIWNQRGELERTIEVPAGPGHGYYGSILGWKPDGSLLAAACADGTTYLLDAEGNRTAELPITAPLAWHPMEDLLHGYSPSLIPGYSSAGKAIDTSLVTHHSILSVVWHPAGQRLAVATQRTCEIATRSDSGWIRDFQSMGIQSWYGLNANPNAIAWSSDGDRVVSPLGRRAIACSADGTSIETLVEAPQGEYVWAMVRNPATAELLIAHTQGAQLLATDGTRKRTIRGLAVNAGPPSFSPDGKWFVAATTEGTMRFYSADGRRGPVLEGSKIGDSIVAWSPDSQEVAIALIGQPAGIWNLDGSADSTLNLPTGNSIYGLTFSPDSQRLAVSGGPVLGVYDRKAGTLQDPLPDGQAGPALRALRWTDSGIIEGIAYNNVNGLPQEGFRRWLVDGRELPGVSLLPGSFVAHRASPTDGKRAIIYADMRHVEFDEDWNPQRIFLPLWVDNDWNDWISLTPDGQVLGHSDQTAKSLRYLVEYDDGRQATLTFDEFHKLTGGVLLPPSKADSKAALPAASSGIDRSAARWALGLGGKVELFVGDEFRELSSASQLPAEGTILLQAIELPAGATISASQFAALARLPALQTLGCYGANLTDSAGPKLAQLAHLEQLGLGKTEVTDAILEHVAKLPQLAHLRLGETQVTDAGLKHLAECKSLRELDLQQTAVTPAGVTELEKALPGCKIVIGTK